MGGLRCFRILWMLEILVIELQVCSVLPNAQFDILQLLDDPICSAGADKVHAISSFSSGFVISSLIWGRRNQGLGAISHVVTVDREI
jgi:hypothetical protein